jgi:hypothetical protein
VLLTIVTACRRDKWVIVTRVWGVLKLRREERPPVWRVAVNILNKQSRTADKGWPSISVVSVAVLECRIFVSLTFKYVWSLRFAICAAE